tara:strand:+ start:431 stop:589 length:159 start_codon:yes stop_codon:yes gene_type:complete
MFSLKICDKGPKKAQEKEPMQILIIKGRKAALVYVNHEASLKALLLTQAFIC